MLDMAHDAAGQHTDPPTNNIYLPITSYFLLLLPSTSYLFHLPLPQVVLTFMGMVLTMRLFSKRLPAPVYQAVTQPPQHSKAEL